MEDYNLSDLMRITGAKRRTLQHWADIGLIRARAETDRAGSGTHRVFSREETVLAAIMQAFADLKPAVGSLLVLANSIRMCIADKDEDFMRTIINPAIAGTSDAVMVFGSFKFEHRKKMHKNWSISFVENPHKVGDALHSMHKPEAFFVAVQLRTYLSKIDD